MGENCRTEELKRFVVFWLRRGYSREFMCEVIIKYCAEKVGFVFTSKKASLKVGLEPLKLFVTEKLNNSACFAEMR